MALALTLVQHGFDVEQIARAYATWMVSPPFDSGSAKLQTGSWAGHKQAAPTSLLAGGCAGIGDEAAEVAGRRASRAVATVV